MKQMALALGADAAPSFENFVVGANAALLEQLRAHCSGALPLYLWGPSGCGKTHLLRALSSQWQRSGAQVGWFDAATALPWPDEVSWPLIVLDHCDALDTAQQHAAFTLYVEAGQAGAAFVAAGRLPPVDLPLRDDLRTRLGWGLVFGLAPLGDAETRAALRREADRRGLMLGDDVLDHLLTRHARDLASLTTLLDRLDAYALAHKRAATLPLLRQMLSESRP